MDQTVRSNMPTHEAVGLLVLPDGLLDQHLDGHVCVWGNETLTPQTAMDLGSRRIGDRLAFPRACRSCTASAAMGALQAHARTCPSCDRDCETGRALNRVLRAATR